MEKSVKEFWDAVKYSSYFVIAIWIVHIFKTFKDISLTGLGIFPREPDGLIGIITSPLVHGSWEHLFSNSVPLFVTNTIIHFFYRRVALPSLLLIYFLTGAAVWMFGRSVYHIGASGVVYGLIAFIFWSGVFRRNIKSIVLSLVVIIMYAGYLAGIVPFQDGISWESHLLGVVVGILVAFFLKNLIEADEEEIDPWQEESDEDLKHYLPRNTFDMTRAERFRMMQEQQQQRMDDSSDL